MRVSVVMPVRNGAEFIAEAIDSALNQPEVDRLVVVDDGSVDDTASIVLAIADPRVHLMRGPGIGVSSARNRGFAELAKSAQAGDFVMFLDADDRLRDGAIGRLIATATPECVAVYGDYERIDARGKIVGRRSWLRGRRKPTGDILRALLGGNFIVNGGVILMRISAFKLIGGFDESLRYSEDWFAMCQLAARGPIAYLDSIVLDYRVHAGSATMRRAVNFELYRGAFLRVFSDPDILGRLEPGEVRGLQAKAEAHLRMFLACQAVRSHAYSRVLPEATRALLSAPRRAPRNVMRIVAAAVGF